MALIENVPTKEEIVERLARGHRHVNQGVTRIFRLLADAQKESDMREPVKLLEISPETTAVGIQPIYFQPSGDIFYPSVVVAITPEEFEHVKTHPDELSHYGWRIGNEIPA